MAADSASNNDNVPHRNGNGNIPTPAPHTMTPPKPTLHTPEGLLTTIVLTIYDVIIFLAVSIGYIIQVSAALPFEHVERIKNTSNFIQLAHRMLFLITHLVIEKLLSAWIRIYASKKRQSLRQKIHWQHLLVLKFDKWSHRLRSIDVIVIIGPVEARNLQTHTNPVWLRWFSAINANKFGNRLFFFSSSHLCFPLISIGVDRRLFEYFRIFYASM